MKNLQTMNYSELTKLIYFPYYHQDERHKFNVFPGYLEPKEIYFLARSYAELPRQYELVWGRGWYDEPDSRGKRDVINWVVEALAS